MTRHRERAGRGFSRPAFVAAVAVVLTGAAFAATRIGPRDTIARGPTAVPNPAASAPRQELVGSVRHVHAGEAPETLILDSVPPDVEAELLWFQGRATHPLPDSGRVTLDGVGGIVRFDRRLRVRRVPARLGGRTLLSVAPNGARGFWATDATGGIVSLADDGTIRDSLTNPFGYAAVSASATGDDVWLSRSNRRWAYRLPDKGEPLLARLVSTESTWEAVGAIDVPEHALLAELANAGHLAVGHDRVFFAPFIRDEVIALTGEGDTLWVAHRGLPQAVAEPKFEVEQGGVQIDYAPVNLGVALGPDDRLYVLSVPGFTTQEVRLDVFELASGRLVRSAVVNQPDLTVAVDADGRVYSIDAFRLMTGVAPAEREPFASFELPLLRGGTMNLNNLEGKVVLVNFWASWCTPCREEMPALDSLSESIAHGDFQFITMNEDVSTSDAAEFIDELGFDFPVLLGRGRLRTQYHYMGLPFTVVLDRNGRVVHQWTGFAGEEQIQGLRAVIEAELLRESEGTVHEHGVDHGSGQATHSPQHETPSLPVDSSGHH